MGAATQAGASTKINCAGQTHRWDNCVRAVADRLSPSVFAISLSIRNTRSLAGDPQDIQAACLY
jgi:hypothetical protein